MTRDEKQFETGRGSLARPSADSAADSSAGALCAELCEAALNTVIHLAQALLEPVERGDLRRRSSTAAFSDRASASAALAHHTSSGHRQTPAEAGSRVTAQQRLTRTLRDLPPETALKLRTLMIAGRDGRAIHAVQTNLTLDDGDAAFVTAADDAGDSGPLLAEYLRRGHALACAAGLDLEQPLASWGNVDLVARLAKPGPAARASA